MNINLDLSAHCIETELKRLYNKSIADYFKAHEKAMTSIEQTIEVVSKILKTIDFAKLRAIYPALAGHTKIPVTLSFGDAPPAITIGDTEILWILKHNEDVT
jgi:hypothetical protein